MTIGYIHDKITISDSLPISQQNKGKETYLSNKTAAISEEKIKKHTRKGEDTMVSITIRKPGNCELRWQIPQKPCITEIPCNAFLVSSPDDWWNARPVMGSGYTSWGRWGIYAVEKVWSVNGRDFFLDCDLLIVLEGKNLRQASVEEAAFHHEFAFLRINPRWDLILYQNLDYAIRELKSLALGIY